MDPRLAHRLVRDELLVEGNARLNLATFCQTWVEPEVVALLAETYDKNMIDKDEYPQTAEIERRCVNIIGGLWNAPAAIDADPTTLPVGTSTTGSSEACMLGGMALKRRWQGRRTAAGEPADRPNIVMGTNVQVCWHKFARYWDVEQRLVPVEGERHALGAEEAVARCDENTIGVVGILGSTFTGEYEPIAGISAALDDLQARTGLDVRSTSTARAAASWRRSSSPTWSGTSACRGSSRSTPRAQVRPGAAGRRMGALARRRRPARGAGLPRELPGRRHAGLRHQLLASRQPGDRAVLQLRPPGPRGLPPDPAERPGRGAPPGRRDRGHGPVPHPDPRAPTCRCSRGPWPTAPTSRSSSSRRRCAPTAGRCRRPRCPPT